MECTEVFCQERTTTSTFSKSSHTHVPISEYSEADEITTDNKEIQHLVSMYKVAYCNPFCQSILTTTFNLEKFLKQKRIADSNRVSTRE